MANRGRFSAQKRRREARKLEKKQKKAEQRAERQEKGDDDKPVPPGEDPDIAGIVPGPQPTRKEFRDLDD